MTSNGKIEAVVFDLDGTLVSSHDTIYEATIATLEELGIKHNITTEPFNDMIGLHFIDIFERFGFSVPDFEVFINIYKKKYFDYIDSSTLYEGVFETLEQVKAKALKTALLTTKGQDQAEKISLHFGLDKYLDVIGGRRPDVKLKPDAEPLLKICAELGVEPAKTIMTGDTEMDILCGKNAGAVTCGVTYGYRREEEIKKLEPDYIISSLKEFESIIG